MALRSGAKKETISELTLRAEPSALFSAPLVLGARRELHPHRELPLLEPPGVKVGSHLRVSRCRVTSLSVLSRFSSRGRWG